MAIDEEAVMFVTGTIGFFGTELDAAPAVGGSFDEVVLPHLDAAYRLARWLMRNEHDAEDVVQEASLRAIRYFRTFTGGDARAWFLTIVRNTCGAWRGRSFHAATNTFDEKATQQCAAGVRPRNVVASNR
jgi:DNA-directed RNA polymerase specialized sigma24 family protein